MRGLPNLRVALAPAIEAFVAAMAKVAQGIAAFGNALHQQDEVWLSGREARYYVRGGLDPAYSTEEGLSTLVHELMHLPGFTRRNRARMAAAAIRGWCAHQDQHTGPVLVAWHRSFGPTVVRLAVQG